jgi:3-hydroxybutyryl-CoA dehydrogenase
MWENLADPIITGRETQGIPKLFADIPDHRVQADQWSATASHFDHRIVDLTISQLRVPGAEEIAAVQQAREGKDNPMAWRYQPATGGFGDALSEYTTFPSENVFTGAWFGEGKVDWNNLTWAQNPTQYHIVNALAGLPVLEYLPAMVTRGSTNLIVPGRPSRVLDEKVQPADPPVAAKRSMTIREVSRVCFAGAGTMGCVNSLVAAIAGYDVVVYDLDEETLGRVSTRQLEFAPFLVGSGYCTEQAIAEAMGRISTSSSLDEAITQADLVSESVFERLDVKREIHRKLDQLCPPGTILTTNSSTLLVSDIEDAVDRGERFAALHSYLGSMLVDIVGGPRTSEKTIDILRRYVLSLRGEPLVLKKENPGYVLNAMLSPLLMSAITLVVDGRATAEEVDRAWMTHCQAPMGPFGMMDMFGLDLVFDQMHQQQPNPCIDALRVQATPFIGQYVDKGELGMKTGKGVYSYPGPAYEQPEFMESSKGHEAVYHALIAAVLQSAGFVALNGVAEPSDIDRAWMIATGQQLGPFGILKRLGSEAYLEICRPAREKIKLMTAEDTSRIDDYVKRYLAAD